ncbi:reverse transcriptase domain-containing protein [Aerosakkonema funiforme]|uniref:reverse transcriptase domain-containing protein n=1 Tax=Aerosakkonema funiforme TaxID=1246630 RepID=UPI0035B918ED
MNLEEAFSKENIIIVLCNLRMACAGKRHEKHFLHNIAKERYNEPKVIEKLDQQYEDIKNLYSMLPPRRLWNHKRPKPQKRKGKVGAEVDGIALRLTVLERLKNPQPGDQKWVDNLNNFINEVQSRVLRTPPYKMATPKILPVEKDPEKKDGKYRPIAKYTDLCDQVVDKLCAKYFRTIFDSIFLDSSYAFRAKGQNSRCPTHHDAVEHLIQFRQTNSEKTLWVAECDIKKFFDCVHHNEAKAALNRLKERTGYEIDPRAEEIFKAYLDSYSFPRDALTQANQWFDKYNLKGKLDWCENDLREIWKDPLQEPIGIPQGGALSCFIVNLMLDLADRAVISNSEQCDPDLLYLRYCDDIIIVHPDKEKCNKAFERYSEALKSLKLVRHEPEKLTSYGKDFWNHKSKEPYKWAYEPNGSSVPWVAFVGYQLRYDGLLRIRPSSIKKELKKQFKEANKILKAVCPRSKNKTGRMVEYSPNIRINRHRIYHRLHQRLISMSVGRIKLEDLDKEPSTFCWCDGFKLLRSHKPVLYSQLKQLDRGRESQLKRVKKKIKYLEVRDNSQGDKSKYYKYYGHPFSYYAQFFDKPNSPSY